MWTLSILAAFAVFTSVPAYAEVTAQADNGFAVRHTVTVSTDPDATFAMLRTPAKLISEISHDVTLEPGDVIACGTNVGVGSMKEPSNTVEIVIDGIGTLSNTFDN